MRRLLRHRILWGELTPLTWLSSGALLIMASDRLAHAIVVTAALLWVYCLTSLASHAAARIFPAQGRVVLLVFLASIIASVLLFLLWLASPLLVLQVFFIVALIPILYLGCGIFERIELLSLGEKVLSSFSEALYLGGLIIGFALIREPLGYVSLSLPGGSQGIILLFSSEREAFLPIRLAASSSGALLLLGYFWGLYRYFKTRNAPKGDKQ